MYSYFRTSDLFKLIILTGVIFTSLIISPGVIFASTYGSGSYNSGQYTVGQSAPTDTPTPVVENNSSNSGNGGTSSGNNNGSSTCTDQPPGSAPDLYEVDTTATAATIYFAPAAHPYTGYYVSFGDGKNNEGYGAGFSLSQTSGALKYDVYHLKQGAVYTFKVRAGNGCTAGSWSDTLTAKTGKNSGSMTKFYPKQQAKYTFLASNLLNSIPNSIKKSVKQIMTVVQNPPAIPTIQKIINQPVVQPESKKSSPQPTAPQKTCFLFFCW